MALRFGVEIEFHVENDPHPNVQHETPYPVMQSHRRGVSQGNIHRRHGNLVRHIHDVTAGTIHIGYDATASFGDSIWEGFELSSIPLDLADTLLYWEALYGSDVKQYLNPNPDIAIRRYAPAHHSCGMHIHLSGDELNPECIEKISRFINLRTHKEFISHIAERYDTQFCRIGNPEAAFFRCLFHSVGCTKTGKIDRGELEAGGCCENHRMLARYIYSGEISRHAAVNNLPNPNTGAIELRLFSAPDTYKRMAANVEFAHALVQFFNQDGWVGHKLFCSWLEQDRNNRRLYRNLFRHLRDGGHVTGLIPRR